VSLVGHAAAQDRCGEVTLAPDAASPLPPSGGDAGGLAKPDPRRLLDLALRSEGSGLLPLPREGWSEGRIRLAPRRCLSSDDRRDVVVQHQSLVQAKLATVDADGDGREVFQVVVIGLVVGELIEAA
jgi:hypothetical protein